MHSKGEERKGEKGIHLCNIYGHIFISQALYLRIKVHIPILIYYNHIELHSTFCCRGTICIMVSTNLEILTKNTTGHCKGNLYQPEPRSSHCSLFSSHGEKLNFIPDKANEGNMVKIQLTEQH